VVVKETDAERQSLLPPALCAGTGKVTGSTMTVSHPADIAASGVPVLDAPMPDDRRERIAVNAYFRAERRGFAGGHELDDWLAAEAEIGSLERSLPEGPGAKH
jgi:hypothetical protein